MEDGGFLAPDAAEFGRRIVTEFGERMFGGADGGPDATAGDDRAAVRDRLLADVARLGEAAADLLGDLVAALALAGSRGPGDGEPVEVLVRTGPGGSGSGLFYVRNAADVPLAGVRPHVGALRSHLGDELPAAAVTFDPAGFEPLPPRSSCGVEVRVEVPAGTAPGRYSALVLVEGLPRVAMPLHVAVAPPEP